VNLRSALDSEQSLDEFERDLGSLGVGAAGFEEVVPQLLTSTTSPLA
jgi:hypothetical protein